MQNLSVSQAQKQFTSILNSPTTIIDKKSNIKKAVILPYEVYQQLIINKNNKEDIKIDSFIGLLSKNIVTDDPRYNEIIK